MNMFVISDFHLFFLGGCCDVTQVAYQEDANHSPPCACLSPPPRCLLLITLHSELSAAAVVMEIDLGPVSSPNPVAMGTRVRNSLSAVEEDEGEELHRHRSNHGGNFSILIVIGDISTDHQLQIAKQHIERGE